MNNSRKIVQFTILAGLFLLLDYSCTKKSWDDHYAKPDYINQGSVVSFLTGKPEYSQFASLLRKTGNDSLLTQGGSYTVFALKNGSFSGIDTIINIVALKKIMGMHIVPYTVNKENLVSGSYLSFSGKLLRFSTESGRSKVNNINILDAGTRVTNGMVYEAGSLIMPLPNILDFINLDPGYSYWKQLIDSSYNITIDPARNIRTGYDSLNVPVYRPPYIYIMRSDYLSAIQIDKENVLSTMFVPNEKAINALSADLLNAHERNASLILPALGPKHGDTTIAGCFFDRNVPYGGKNAELMAYLNNNVISRGEVSPFTSGVKNFVTTSGNMVTINGTDIVPNSTKYASNGYIYTVNKITLPDLAFRRRFSVLAAPSLRNIANILVSNPNFTASFASRKGFSPTITVDANGFASFNFVMIGAEMDLVFPFVLKGYYDLSIRLLNPGDNNEVTNGYFQVYYNSVMLARFQDNTKNQPNPDFKMFLSKLNVAQSGPVKITIRMSDLEGGAGSKLTMKQLYLDPVNK